MSSLHKGNIKNPNMKAKDFKTTMKKLLKYLGRYKIGLFFVIIFSIGSTIFSILGPKIMGNATTELFSGLMSKISGGSGIDFDKIENILLTLIMLYVLSAFFSFIQGYIMSGISQKFTYKIRKEISEKINKMPMSYFDKRTHGEVLSIITNDVDTLNQSLNQSITQIITSICTLIGIFFMMLSINLIMTFTVLLVIPISLLLISVIVKRSQKHFKLQQEYLGHVNGKVEEAYGGQNIVKLFNAEQKEIEKFNEGNEVLYKSAWKSQFLSGLMQPVTLFIRNLSYASVAILGRYLTINGQITVGDIQTFIQYSRNFTQPISQIAQVSNLLQSIAACSERIFEFLEEEEEEQIVSNPKSIENIQGDVTFKNVDFGYKKDKLVLKDFSVKIKKGQKVAIVGPTGAGKSTIVKLLMRFYDVDNGGIFIDGINIKDFNRRELRKLFSMVLQDTWLFNGSIKENIRYGKLNATDDEIIKATKSAEIDDYIESKKEKYDMVLNEEGTNISQGEKQLLTIARAILADAKILILDEATSSVDTRTEIKIQNAMDNLMKGRTSFVIAHRLSTIKNADCILVVKDGDIIEQGNHEELMKANGFYTNLYNSQFEKKAN